MSVKSLFAQIMPVFSSEEVTKMIALNFSYIQISYCIGHAIVSCQVFSDNCQIRIFGDAGRQGKNFNRNTTKKTNVTRVHATELLAT